MKIVNEHNKTYQDECIVISTTNMHMLCKRLQCNRENCEHLNISGMFIVL